jgi:hypothetical protein
MITIPGDCITSRASHMYRPARFVCKFLLSILLIFADPLEEVNPDNRRLLSDAADTL